MTTTPAADAAGRQKPLWFLVADCETTVVKKPDGKWDARPYVYDKSNGFVAPRAFAAGSLLLGLNRSVAPRWERGSYRSIYNLGAIGNSPFDEYGELPVVVGHNIKFDVQHIPALAAASGYWDTMIAEYILTAQRTKFASLASLVTKYTPARFKPDLIGASLATGITPDKIERSELEAYLSNDVMCTADVFQAQWDASTPRQRSLILLQSAASIVYAEIETNGLRVDTGGVHARSSVLESLENKAKTDILGLWESSGATEQVLQALAHDNHKALMSPRAMSAYFFGSPKAFDVKVPKPPGATGRGKYVVATITPPPGRLTIPALTVGARAHATAKGVYLLGDEVLENLSGDSMAAHVRNYRKVQKLRGTYYDAWLEDIGSHYIDGCLHPTIHAVSTDTGRTSSANPNSQNMPDEVRECIVSRTDGGSIIEADFKQLEIVGLAIVSGCAALKEALRRGDDLHYISGRSVFGWKTPADMSKALRTVVKRVNFGLIYGGSPKGLAAQIPEVSEATVRDLIESFYANFPGVAVWHKATYRHVYWAPDDRRIEPGPGGTVPVHILKTLTGREYGFPLEPPPYNLAAIPRPSPTKVKNYPVQGFSTGDVVPLALVLLRAALRRDGLADVVKIINVVHDSVLLDCPDGHVGTVDSRIRDVVRRELPAAIESMWDYVLDVPLEVDIKTGTRWAPLPIAYSPLS